MGVGGAVELLWSAVELQGGVVELKWIAVEMLGNAEKLM
jgi:hypothetical protein